MGLSFNFPENLNISPSRCLSRLGVYESSDQDDNMEKVFGQDAQQDAIQKYGIAGRVWEAAYALIRYVCPPPGVIFDPPFVSTIAATSLRFPITVLELGSGTGVVISCIVDAVALPQDLFIATDLPEVCPLLEKNLARNNSQNHVVIMPLSWGNATHGFNIFSELLSSSPASRKLSHIICSDLVYFPELYAPLLRTLIQLTSPPFLRRHSDVSIVISYKIRSFPKESRFWSAFGLWFNFNPVLVADTSLSSESQQIGELSGDMSFIFIAQRHPKSYSWTVPENDEDLLAGKGTMGNFSTKTDDTFETLLLMRTGISDLWKNVFAAQAWLLVSTLSLECFLSWPSPSQLPVS